MVCIFQGLKTKDSKPGSSEAAEDHYSITYPILFSQLGLQDPGYIFSNDVEFDINDTPRYKAVEIGYLVGKGNDGYLEAPVF
jgi:hypothetical protein